MLTAPGNKLANHAAQENFNRELVVSVHFVHYELFIFCFVLFCFFVHPKKTRVFFSFFSLFNTYFYFLIPLSFSCFNSWNAQIQYRYFMPWSMSVRILLSRWFDPWKMGTVRRRQLLSIRDQRKEFIGKSKARHTSGYQSCSFLWPTSMPNWVCLRRWCSRKQFTMEQSTCLQSKFSRQPVCRND